jgi:hypothetical protein
MLWDGCYSYLKVEEPCDLLLFLHNKLNGPEIEEICLHLTVL